MSLILGLVGVVTLVFLAYFCNESWEIFKDMDHHDDV